MLLRTLEHRGRNVAIPKQGDLVFFWRDKRVRRKQNPASSWVGPGYVVGHQGDNCWITCGGRCFLVAAEHVRSVVGDEKQYGIPEAQMALASFRKSNPEDTYEDLTKQQGPGLKDKSLEEVEVDLLEDDENDPKEANRLDDFSNCMQADKLTGNLKGLDHLPVGWHKDVLGNDVQIAHRAVAFRTPIYSEKEIPGRYRTTWGKMSNGKWWRLECDVDWTTMDNPHRLLPEIPVRSLITIFATRKRKDDLGNAHREEPSKRSKGVFAVSTQKQKRMLDKEIPYEKIPSHEKWLYEEAEKKEWDSWLRYDTVEMLSEDESNRVRREKADRIVRSRMVYRNKNAGLRNEHGVAVETKAKARLCVLGQFAPGVVEGTCQVDSPTVQRVTMYLFLNWVISMGWTSSWRVGDVSSAFLQGDAPPGEPLFMEQSVRGLPGVPKQRLFRLKKAVYGLPEAPRCWYNCLSRILVSELKFEKSLLDPSLFVLRGKHNKVIALLTTHVDDIMVAGDGSVEAESVISKLHERLPFVEWSFVEKQPGGVTYCGKDMAVREENGEKTIAVSQHGFIEGRLEEIPMSNSRKKEVDQDATPEEITDYRSTLGSLMWVSAQTRADAAFETNQLLKRIPTLKVADLLRANRLVRELKAHPFEIKLRSLGNQWDLVVFHDASLFSSVGKEICDQEADDLLFGSNAKKLVYSQRGCVIGFVARGNHKVEGKFSHMNVVDWKSSTIRRTVESSFAAETFAAIQGHSQGKYCQALIAELLHGSDTMRHADDATLEHIQPMFMITDCKSIYDCVHKPGQHVTFKGSILSIVLLREICETVGEGFKSKLLWVPSELQLADALTKVGEALSLGRETGM